MTCKGKTESFHSLYEELLTQINVLVAYYVMERQCKSINSYLHGLTVHTLTSMLTHLQELIGHVDTLIIYAVENEGKNIEANEVIVRNTTGMIWSIQEDLKKLPQSNRVCVRR